MKFLKDLYTNAKFNYLLWLDSRKESDKRLNLILPSYTKETQKEAYYQGIAKIRKHVQQLITAPTREEYERVLKELTELQDYAIKNGSADYLKFIDNLKKVYVYDGADIKSDTDKARMVDRRIRDYEELRAHKEKREKLRAERNKNNG